MRLQPVEKPKGFMLRLAYYFSRKQFGKVMTPMQVVLARMPGSAKVSYNISKFAEKGIRLDRGLHFMIANLAAQINGCGFCIDIGRAAAIRAHLGMEKFNALLDYRSSPLFSARERAALAYAEEATRHKHVSDATFDELRKHFNDREIVEITWINALENFYNLVNIPLEIESDGLCAIAQAHTKKTQPEKQAHAASA